MVDAVFKEYSYLDAEASFLRNKEYYLELERNYQLFTYFRIYHSETRNQAK